MKNILKAFFAMILSLSLVLHSYAIDAPANLKLDSKQETSVNLSWDVVSDAFMYYLKYDKSSGIDSGYEMETDFVESNNLEITDLEQGVTYYFTVISLDQNGEESSLSDELVIDMVDSSLIETNQVDFALDSIEVISYDKIELDFTDSLDNSEDTMREFKIVNKNDNLDTFEVLSTELNANDDSKIELTLDRDTEVGSEYEVVIIAITSSNGNNIESGIDNTETFNVEEIVELNAAEENPVVEEESVVEVVTVDEVVKEEPTGPTGANIDSSEVENTTLALAENSDNLPKTGPEHILILILSIILGSLIFVLKFKRS